MRAALLPLLLLLATPAAAWGQAVPLSRLTDEAERVVVGRVGPRGETLAVDEVLLGDLQAAAGTLRLGRPLPARPGARVVAFLVQGPQGWQAFAGEAGLLSATPAARGEAVAARVRARLELAGPRGELVERDDVEWLVGTAEDIYTRWHGAFELGHYAERPGTCGERCETRPADKLDPDQRRRLEEALLADPARADAGTDALAELVLGWPAAAARCALSLETALARAVREGDPSSAAAAALMRRLARARSWARGEALAAAVAGGADPKRTAARFLRELPRPGK